MKICENLSKPRDLFFAITIFSRIHTHITCMRKQEYRLVSLASFPSTKFNRNPLSSAGAKMYIKRKSYTRAFVYVRMFVYLVRRIHKSRYQETSL